MKTMGFLVLWAMLSMAAHNRISDAVSASSLPVPQTQASLSIAAIPPLLDTPAAGTDPDAPAGNPRNPNSTPVTAPVPTNHYAGPANNPSGRVFYQVSVVFFPEAGDRIPS